MFKTNHWYHWISALAFWMFAAVFYMKGDINVMGYGSTPIVVFLVVQGFLPAGCVYAKRIKQGLPVLRQLASYPRLPIAII
jgi:hypothetical protein